MTNCPKCNQELTREPGMFHWRGRDFYGLVCRACKSLWDDPTDSFEEYVGLKAGNWKRE